MNRIRGWRTKAGLRLWVDEYELDPAESLKVRSHSPDGFNAGYSGSGPAQSALAILLHVLKDEEKAQELYQEFKFEFLSKHEYLDVNDFAFDVDIVEWAKKKEGAK